jgi:hypothetical protein
MLPLFSPRALTWIRDKSGKDDIEEKILPQHLNNESEVRKLVFWVGYILDQDTSLRSGRPAAQDDSDMDMSLPDENPSDGVGDMSLSSGTGKCNIFRFYCELGLIQSKVHKMPYSVKASAYTSEETSAITAVLNCELDKWKDRLPQEFRPGHVSKR